MFRVSKDYKLRKINNYYFLASKGTCLNRKWIYELNETGARIWEICNNIRNTNELVSLLSQIYNKDFTKCEKKAIYLYIVRLEKEGLIQRCE